MKRTAFILVIVVIFFVKNGVMAQEQKVSANFKDQAFPQVVQQLESISPYRFFYDPADGLDTFKVNIHSDSISLDGLLDTIFHNTTYRSAIDFRKYVYITKTIPVVVSIPSSFFEDQEDNQEKNQKFTDAPVQSTNKALAVATLESKTFQIGTKDSDKSPNATLSGIVKDIDTGEPVVGASIAVEGLNTGAASDQFGYYSITLPKGSYQLSIKSAGMKDTKRKIVLNSNGTFNIEMKGEVQGLKEVVVESEKAGNVKAVQMGQERLTIKTIKQLPAVFGEADILRAVLTMPGVKTVGEASTGFNVRGGSADQNLILFNDATVYNPSHLFGFFSAFNPDMVKSVELYKSNIPAKYGGRISSVLEVNTREGNKKKFTGAGGIGLITGRLTLEGPIIKDRTSFLIGGRTTYSNWLLSQLKNSAYSKSRAGFYDLNLNISHQINKNNDLFITGYISKDNFKFQTDTVYAYGNQNLIVKWKHNINNKLYSVVTGNHSAYNYSVTSSSNPVNAFQLSYAIKQYNAKVDFSYFIHPKHTLDFGVSTLMYKLEPGTYKPIGSSSVTPDVIQKEQALESGIYLSDKFEVNQRISITAGVRVSLYNFLGPKAVNNYAPETPRTVYSITDTTNYQNGKMIKTYGGPEFRLSARYMITENTSVKFSYNTQRQYIHMLSNTTAVSPTDTWKLSDSYIKPTLGDQISLGIYKNLRQNSIETSIEVYHKNIRNFLDYKGGAQLIMNHHIETDLLNTKGKAYGIEFMIRKTTGKLNGWISYTYSRTFLQTDEPAYQQPVNNGSWYPANYDKPHDFSLIGNYKFSHRCNFSTNVIYNTGRPITLPIAKYNIAGTERILYGNRNQYRIPDYFRIDVSLNVEGNHKIKKLAHSSWTFAIYNLLGRRNAYSVYFVTENGKINGYKLSIFGQAIPTITYNFRF